MAYTTLYNDIVFIEGNNEDANIVGNINSDLSFKIGAQLKNLNDVKQDMSIKAKALGANCILDFTYGQKSRWLFSSAFLPPSHWNSFISKQATLSSPTWIMFSPRT